MKKMLTTVLITSIATVLVLGGLSFVVYRQNQKIQGEITTRQEQELDLLTEDSVREVFDEREITALDLDMTEGNPMKVYTKEFTEEQNKRIKKNKKKNLYDFESPMFIWNLYGTNNLSLYTYFKTSEAVSIRYTIQAEDADIPNFTRTLYNGEADGVTREHEYQITGFVQGMENLLIMNMYDESDHLLNRKVYEISVPALKSGVDTRLDTASGRSENLVSNGLYAVFGKKDIWLYDNSGILRGEIPLTERSSQKLLNEEGALFFAPASDSIVKIGSLGQVEKRYSLGKYVQYEDFVYNGYGDLWILAYQEGKKSKSIRDAVISLSLDDAKVSELFCMEDLLPKMKRTAKKPKGEKKLNWIDLNSITQVNSDEVLVSSRELSSIFKVVDINSRSPRISFIIGEDAVWKGTAYEKKLLAKTGQDEADAQQEAAQEESVLNLGAADEVFYATFGQTWIQAEKDDALSEGQYYLYVWDSNYGYSPTRKGVKWSAFHKVGSNTRDARVSYIRKYLIDENNAEYNLLDSETKEISYTKKQGSMQFYGNHQIYNFGCLKEYAEYDQEGKMIRKFTHKIPGIYRIEKLDFKEFWFQ